MTQHSVRMRIAALASLVLLALVIIRPAPAAYLRAAPLSQQPAPGGSSLADAAKAERDGDYSQAEADYRQLAAASDAATAASGQLGLGRFLVRHGRSGEALMPLQAATAALGGSANGLRATFLLGEAEAALQQDDAAVASFQAYVQGNGPAKGYALLEEAWALQDKGDDQTALQMLLAPLLATSTVIRSAALTAASTSLERLGDPASAAGDENTLAGLAETSSDRASALQSAARLYVEAGDNQDAGQALLTIVQKYPRLSAATSALDTLDGMGVSVDPLQRAMALFYNRRNGDAQTAFQSALNQQPAAGTAAEITYFLAVIADRQNQNDAALAGYKNAYDLNPAGDVAALALWGRAQLLRSLNRSREAQSDYSNLAQQFPKDVNASDAAFDAGLMAYLDGRSSDAAAIWTPLLQSADVSLSSRAAVWQAKLALAQSDRNSASQDLAKAQAISPDAYYGLRAGVLAAGLTSPSLSGGLVSPPAADWTSVETWLTGWAGQESTSQFQALQATQDWTEGMELSTLEWQLTPNQLLGDAIGSVSSQPWALYRAARLLSDRGLTQLAMLATENLLNLAPGSDQSVPPTLLRLAYPLDYVDLVNQDAAQNGLDPLLIDALVRQESAFNPSAGSSAGAQGLAQLIPSTAQSTASALGLSTFTASDVLRPNINLMLGAYYLAQQAQQVNGDLSKTLAAYNGGLGNTQRWAKLANGDADLFYESIDFSETQLYVRAVSDNYAFYNFLYRGAARPTLVH